MLLATFPGEAAFGGDESPVRGAGGIDDADDHRDDDECAEADEQHGDHGDHLPWQRVARTVRSAVCAFFFMVKPFPVIS